jgi:hypothetical protein
MSHRFRKTGMAVLLGASLLGGAGLPGGAVTVQAQGPPDRHYRCERRIRQAEANLQRAIARHGENSRQAERRRRELEEIRARCRGQL